MQHFFKSLGEQLFLLLRPQCTVLFSLLNVEVYPEKRLDSRKCAKTRKLSAATYVNEVGFPRVAENFPLGGFLLESRVPKI